jgi:hypothetical protein
MNTVFQIRRGGGGRKKGEKENKKRKNKKKRFSALNKFELRSQLKKIQ